MECQRSALLVVLTLLQLCRAAINDGQPQWYSANVINDVFQPKPISEIFSTEAPFSTANPIIVSSKNSDDNIRVLSTLIPPTSLSSSATFEPSSTEFPSSTQPNQLSSFSPNQSPLPQFSSSPPLVQSQQFIPNMDQNQLLQQINRQIVKFQQQSPPGNFDQLQTTFSSQPLLEMISELQGQPQRSVQIQAEQPTPASTLPQDIQFKLVPQNGLTSTGPELSAARSPQALPPLSNYFLIYQQPPQTIQIIPNQSSSPGSITGQDSFTTTNAPPITSTLSTPINSPPPTFSTISNFPTTMPTSPLFFNTTRPRSSATPKVTVTSLSTFGSSSGIVNTDTRNANCVLPLSTTPLPTLYNGQPISISQLLPLKIRVVAPSGSITNVNINPTYKHQISTQYKTTTRKPKTARTPRPRKNTYERCLQGCRKNGQTLCAAPLAQLPVDPKTLRGFPSVCHMACHNSYRKDAFEKVIDGRCSKLRTRIRLIDSDSKLKREELQRVQYSLENSEEQPILEFTGIYS